MENAKIFKTVEEFREFIDLDLDRYKDCIFKSIVEGNDYELFDVVKYCDLGSVFSRKYIIGTKLNNLKAIFSIVFDTNIDEKEQIHFKWKSYHLYINDEIEKFIREE